MIRTLAIRRVVSFGAGFPYHILDLLFAVGAEIFSKAPSVETCQNRLKLWSGSGRVLRRLPHLRTGRASFPASGSSPSKGAVGKHPVDDGSSLAMDLPVTIGVKQGKVIDAV